MASIAQTLPKSGSPLAWLGQFLESELAPYAGRTALVTRIAVASTLVMIISMTFRLPYGAFGAIFAFLLSRESLETTANAVWNIVVGFALAGGYIILGLVLTLGDPVLRFLWITAGFFIGFWALSALRNYSASGRFGYLMSITIALWDANIPQSSKVENTLWAAGVITLASLITLFVEMLFASLRKSDDLIDPISERLQCVEELLTGYSSGDPAKTTIPAKLARLAMTGTSRMRLTLHRSGFDQQYADNMSAVVALTGRLVDLAATLPAVVSSVPPAEHERIGKIANRIKAIREDLAKGVVPRLPEPETGSGSPSAIPLLGEMSHTVSLIDQAFAGAPALRVFAPAATHVGSARTPISKELLHSEHFRFAIRGTLAATASYIAFNALFRPEISTAVTTCFLTALTTMGASRQKQVLRIGGALIGGFGMGMGAQVFILPYIDTIAGFAVVYMVAIWAAAWIATSSPRLSYLGAQLAVAFCLINLSEFRFQTSLTVARDRVIGILLGLVMMWLFYDQLWTTNAGLAMRKGFISGLRMLAQLARWQVSKSVEESVKESYELRERIAAQFDQVRTHADAVLFEFGPSRRRDLEFREYIRELQPQLRTLFVIRIAFLKYRLQTPGFELPGAVQVRQKLYDEASARVLDGLADRIEGREPSLEADIEKHELRELLEAAEEEASRSLPGDQAQSFLTLLREIDSLTSSLAAEMEHGI